MLEIQIQDKNVRNFIFYHAVRPVWLSMKLDLSLHRYPMFDIELLQYELVKPLPSLYYLNHQQKTKEILGIFLISQHVHLKSNVSGCGVYVDTHPFYWWTTLPFVHTRTAVSTSNFQCGSAAAIWSANMATITVKQESLLKSSKENLLGLRYTGMHNN